MRVWIDVTNSPHVVFFRPLVDLLEARGHEVTISARDFAQTLELLEDAGLEHTVVGPPHAGASRTGKVRAMSARLLALRRFARARDFDVALSHASHELPLAARSLGIPSSYAFDYEFARAQHGLGCRAATRVVVPEVIPQSRLDRIGARSRKVRRYPGLKEEYYLDGFTPDAAVLDALRVDPDRVLAVVRTPPDVSLYHRHRNPLFADVLERLGHDPGLRAVPARAGQSSRRPEPRRARRSGRLRRRDHEPRGGRARNARLHDLHGADGRRRRAPRCRGTAANARERGRHRGRAQATGRGPRDPRPRAAPRPPSHSLVTNPGPPAKRQWSTFVTRPSP